MLGHNWVVLRVIVELPFRCGHIESIGISRVKSLLLTLRVRSETGRRLRNTIVLSMKHR